jgi:hypothetical protein
MPLSKKPATCELSHISHCKVHEILPRTIQNDRLGMLTHSVALLLENVNSHTAACTRALLEHFNWELFDLTSYSSELVLSEYLQFIYLNWCDHSVSTITSWWKVSKCGQAHRWQTSIIHAYRNVFPDRQMPRLMVLTMLRSRLNIYILYFLCIE